jgi:hypothetical protein
MKKADNFEHFTDEETFGSTSLQSDPDLPKSFVFRRFPIFAPLFFW